MCPNRFLCEIRCSKLIYFINIMPLGHIGGNVIFTEVISDSDIDGFNMQKPEPAPKAARSPRGGRGPRPVFPNQLNEECGAMASAIVPAAVWVATVV